jgi:ribosomal protein L3 glutamine methyltransferase
MTELKTIRDMLRYAVSEFRRCGIVHGHGTTSAIDEAAFLILETLHLPVDDINPWLDANLLAAEVQALMALVSKRTKTRQPVAYLLNKIYLQGQPFFVDERVIIPRSFIAEVMAKGDLQNLMHDPAAVVRVLDICTGSGCLAVLAAQAFPEARVDATDLSTAALEVAAINVRDHGLRDRISLQHGDLFAPVEGKVYDLIIANPPYVAKAEVDAFPPEYQAEPVMAHIGGTDGLDLVRRILRAVPNHLAPGGTLICEIGTGQHILAEEFADLDLLWLDTEESEGEVFVLKA